MARRSSAPPTPKLPANLSAEQLRAGIPKLQRRIVDLDAIKPENLTDFFSEARSIVQKINATLLDVFGADTIEYENYEVNWASFTLMIMGETPRHLEIEQFHGGIHSARRNLQTAIDVMTERLEDLLTLPEQAPPPSRPATPPNSNIFVVHGHDNAAREEVARFVSKAGLNPIILHEQASGGRTVIEKLEHYSDVGFAVVLLTPDDRGGPMGGDLQPRARQNVIAELFYFLGKLGRPKVCALMKGDLETPSDIGGIVYVPLDPHGGWKTTLLRELEDAGYMVDWASALR